MTSFGVDLVCTSVSSAQHQRRKLLSRTSVSIFNKVETQTVRNLATVWNRLIFAILRQTEHTKA